MAAAGSAPASRTVLTTPKAYFLRGTVSKEKAEKRKNKKRPGFKHVLKLHLLPSVSLLSRPRRLCPPAFFLAPCPEKSKGQERPLEVTFQGWGATVLTPDVELTPGFIGSHMGQWPVPGQGLGAPRCSAHCSPRPGIHGDWAAARAGKLPS